MHSNLSNQEITKHNIFAKCIGPSHTLPLADCMSFSCKFKIIRNGNSYDSRTQPEMSAQEDQTTGELETGIF